MSDFMDRWCDKAKNEAMSVAMDSDGSVWGYNRVDIGFNSKGNRFHPKTAASKNIQRIGQDDANKHLWRESKRIRTPQGWVKA